MGYVAREAVASPGTVRARSACVALSALLLAPPAPASGAVPPPEPIAPADVRGVVVDPSDHLRSQPNAAALARALVERAAANSINTIYLNAYNVEYGAHYRTTYPHNTESHYGRGDLLGKLIAAAHARGVQVFAGLYDHQHRGAWEANPSWRAKRADGSDYNPPRTDVVHYLSVGHPDARAWWMGFLRDLIQSYPALDGVELREPVVNWWGTTADHNAAVTAAFVARFPGKRRGGAEWVRFRRELLTSFLKEEIAIVRAAGMLTHVTTVASAWGDGTLMDHDALARETGFDLRGLLAGGDLPDAVKVELIWQQWARVYDYVAFTPGWTEAATSEFLEQVEGRVPVIVHVELTDFGRRRVTNDEFARTLVAAHRAGNVGLDFYSVSLADQKRSWPVVRAIFRDIPLPVPETPGPRALVLYDEARGVRGAVPALSRLAATSLANLLGHFGTPWEVARVEDYIGGRAAAFSHVFYLGTTYDNAPQAFLSDVSVYDGTLIWIGHNLHQLRAQGVRVPFVQQTQELREDFEGIAYRGRTLPIAGGIIATRTQRGATVLASATGPRGPVPYVMRARNLWYTAGIPFVGTGELDGRALAFADLLHDMLGVPHRTERAALVRIDGVTPRTDPNRLRAHADALARAGVPFAVRVTPFFVDAASGARLSLTQRPQLADALRDAAAKGGTIVLHGSTHQYRGTTGTEPEFWDAVNAGGVPEDGEPFVRPRVEAALAEAWRAGSHPLAWATPGDAATRFDYTQFGDFFSTFVERRTYGAHDWVPYVQAAPYRIAADVHGARIHPDNLGTLDVADPAGALARARALAAVRDAEAGIGISVDLPARTTRALVEGLRASGYGSVDLASLPNVVSGEHRTEISTRGRVAHLVPEGWFLQQALVSPDGRVVRSSATRHPESSRVPVVVDEERMIVVLRALERLEDAGLLGRAARPVARTGALILSTTLGLTALLVLLLGISWARVRRMGRVSTA